MLYVIILYMYLLMQRIKIYVIGNSERFFFCKRRLKFLLLLILSNDCTSVRTAAWIFFSLSHSSLFLSLSLSRLISFLFRFRIVLYVFLTMYVSACLCKCCVRCLISFFRFTFAPIFVLYSLFQIFVYF